MIRLRALVVVCAGLVMNACGMQEAGPQSESSEILYAGAVVSQVVFDADHEHFTLELLAACTAGNAFYLFGDHLVRRYTESEDGTIAEELDNTAMPSVECCASDGKHILAKSYGRWSWVHLFDVSGEEVSKRRVQQELDDRICGFSPCSNTGWDGFLVWTSAGRIGHLDPTAAELVPQWSRGKLCGKSEELLACDMLSDEKCSVSLVPLVAAGLVRKSLPNGVVSYVLRMVGTLASGYQEYVLPRAATENKSMDGEPASVKMMRDIQNNCDVQIVQRAHSPQIMLRTPTQITFHNPTNPGHVLHTLPSELGPCPPVYRQFAEFSDGRQYNLSTYLPQRHMVEFMQYDASAHIALAGQQVASEVGVADAWQHWWQTPWGMREVTCTRYMRNSLCGVEITASPGKKELSAACRKTMNDQSEIGRGNREGMLRRAVAGDIFPGLANREITGRFGPLPRKQTKSSAALPANTTS